MPLLSSVMPGASVRSSMLLDVAALRAQTSLATLPGAARTPAAAALREMRILSSVVRRSPFSSSLGSF